MESKRRFNKYIFYFLLFISVSLNDKIHSQSLYGFNGLLTIPTAQPLNNSEFVLGSSVIHRSGINYSRLDSDKLVVFIGLGFLPFLEVDFRITRNLKPTSQEAIGDRTPSLRLLLKKEEDYFPSILIGWHDIFSAFGGPDANNFNSTYIVLSKNFQIMDVSLIHLSAGYGFKIFKAANYQFTGPFGGVSVSLIKNFELMGEYDVERLNAGLRLTLFNHITFIVGLMNLKYFSGGMSFLFIL